MRYRKVGRGVDTFTVSAIGLGEMPLSVAGRPDRTQAINTIHAALDAGMTFIDTADAYCLTAAEMGHGERLVAAALASYGSDTTGILVATKGGHTRGPDGSWSVDGRPEYLKRACEQSLKTLGVPAIGLYQYHRPGISNANVTQIALADRILDERLAVVQNQFAPNFRSSEGELNYCRDNGIAFLPWSPLGGIGNASGIERRYPAFVKVAAARGISAQQATLAWMLAKGPNVIPIPGSSRPETAVASAAAADIELSVEEVALLDAA
jgi:aryl-alcohol dehydrogenase-like predicted oxidoreductase